MKNLKIKALAGLLFLASIMGLALFVSAGTINYWQGWVYLIIFFLSAGVITLYLMKKDLGLLQRRMNAGPVAEKEANQKIIQFIAQFAFLLVIIIPAIDRRCGWSAVRLYEVVAGDILVVIGFSIVFLVFKENTFTSAIIEVDAKQKVISSGPYSVVRHPMYSGALLMLAGTPVALGSWWGLPAIIPIIIVIVFRLLDEEKFLLKNLSGYPEYYTKTRFRLVPYIW